MGKFRTLVIGAESLKLPYVVVSLLVQSFGIAGCFVLVAYVGEAIKYDKIDKIRTTEQVNAAFIACATLKLDALVIIGGVTSNTDAGYLADFFAERKCSTKVIGIPVTSNGDLKNLYVEANVGFDTICKVNSLLVGNTCTDALSSNKYHLIRLIGGKSSYVALECALHTLPNMAFLAEEVAENDVSLSCITKRICDTVQARGLKGKNHGVILLSEGLIESIPEVFSLAQDIQCLIREGVSADSISTRLSESAAALYEIMPPFIKEQFLLPHESDESAELSQVETEKLLAYLVTEEIDKRLKAGTYNGKKFDAICHFYGYQSHGSFPTKFDCDYAYVLGHIGYHITSAGLNGYMATVTNLKHPVSEWRCAAVPITVMMAVKSYGSIHNANPVNPALHPTLVDLKGKAYEMLTNIFDQPGFSMDDRYVIQGPMQFDGPKAITLCVEENHDGKKLIL